MASSPAILACSPPSVARTYHKRPATVSPILNHNVSKVGDLVLTLPTLGCTIIARLARLCSRRAPLQFRSLPAGGSTRTPAGHFHLPRPPHAPTPTGTLFPAALAFEPLRTFSPMPDSQRRPLSPAFLSCLLGGCDFTGELFLWGQGRGFTEASWSPFPAFHRALRGSRWAKSEGSLLLVLQPGHPRPRLREPSQASQWQSPGRECLTRVRG